MKEDTEWPEISEHTTVNELADIVRRLEHSLTLRIYDEAHQVFGAIRLVTAEELDQIDHLRHLKPTSAHIH
jgi:16S rRNA C1402 N4-methylase RsmH|tara:strand:+ start:1590 stop:1802 length:213 start_codon:yes stop_codon:yes gene_type:complete